jgi:hypothetical protein
MDIKTQVIAKWIKDTQWLKTDEINIAFEFIVIQ